MGDLKKKNRRLVVIVFFDSSESRQLSRTVNFERSQSIPSRQNHSTDRGNLYLTTSQTTTVSNNRV